MENLGGIMIFAKTDNSFATYFRACYKMLQSLKDLSFFANPWGKVYFDWLRRA